jgi:Flp pilus assembly protein TadD
VKKNPSRPPALSILTAAGAIAAAGALVAITAMTAAAAVPPNLGKAIEAQKQLANARPQDAAVFNDLGNLLMVAHQPTEAEAAYRRAVEIDPKRVSALFNLGLLQQQGGNGREAKGLYDKVIAIEPQHAWAHYQLGTLYEGKGDKTRAINEYAQAFSLDPQLAFREVNPQVVENNLVTESLLVAYRRQSAASEAPAIYDEPSHIRDLLMPPERKEAKSDADAAQHATVLRQKDLPPGTNVGQATPPGGQTKPGVAPGRAGTPYMGAGVPNGAGYNPQTGAKIWNRPTPAPSDGLQPGAVVTPPPTGLYYRPSVPSTGRLDSQVVPFENG